LKSKSRYAVAAALAACVHAIPSYAARPFVTDDARIVDAGGCQIETFVKRQRHFSENEFWFVPGCSPAGPVELTLGGTRTDSAAEGTSSSVLAQAKTLVRELRPDDYGLAITLGAARLNPVDSSRRERWSPYLNLIASLSLMNDRTVIHANIGALRDPATGRTRQSWGLGAEFAVTPRVYVIAEAYGQEGDRPSGQFGLRVWVVPNRLQIDGALGAQAGQSPARAWTSFGARILFQSALRSSTPASSVFTTATLRRERRSSLRAGCARAA